MTTRAFRFGVHLSRASTAAEWRDTARRAEELGYDVLSVPDHAGAQLSPFAALTAAAGATTRLRLATLVLDNDFRHPVLAAHEAVTVHLLSEGRLELGLGAGWHGPDYARLGIPFDPPATRFERFREAVEIVERYLRGESFSFSGEHYRLDGVEPLRLPPGMPRPPLVVGGGGPRMLGLAARRADVASVFLKSLSDGSGFHDEEMHAGAYRAKVERVRSSARDVEINLLLQGFEITGDRKGAAEAHARRFGTTPERYLTSPFGLVGTLDQVVDDLVGRREELGISYVTVFGEHLEAFAPVVERLAGT